MNQSCIKLLHDLEKIGIEKGDRLLVHSSFKSLGEVEGGIETVITALKEAVGTGGTLMLPTFTYNSVTRENPTFDIKASPSCVGMIPEIFRKSDGVIRSLHPPHSLAVWGKDKEYYVKDHIKDPYVLGKNSPIYKLLQNSGKILLLGCTPYQLTILHGLEAHCKVPYVFKADYNNPKFHREYTCIDENGIAHKNEFFHMFATVGGYNHDFIKLKNIMELKTLKILEADCYLFNAKELWCVVEDALKRDPFCLASKI